MRSRAYELCQDMRKRDVRWTGPHWDGRDYADSTETTLKGPVPPERWPYGAPDEHDDCCLLFEGGLYCDCFASASDE